ncbi:DUF6751 family protein [Candidatus Stoquefichus sp. SB1]|uniref:DUF6751 family protein n=1 Tax=Candidatus Stoquefichus sp. SB1 TaxID=1658109 RepID=UPI00067EB7A9|nr:DUF6751 family protein [Candidatus Stoquefichus sp. SB1]
MFNKDITIFNKLYNKEKRTDVYKRTVLKGVHTEMTQSSDFTDKEMRANDTLFVSIPFSFEGYVKPKEYQENFLDKWTLQEGDIIVVGVIENDIDSPKYLKHLDDSYTIKSVDVIDYSVTCLNHFEVYAS